MAGLMCTKVFPAKSHESDSTTLQSFLSTTVTNQPSLRARQTETQATQTDVAAAQMPYWPTPSFSVQRPNKALIVGTDLSTTTISLRQPLWTGGRLEAGLAYVDAKQQTTETTREETRKDIALEVIQAYADAYTKSARLKDYVKSLKNDRKLLEQIQGRARNGTAVESNIALAQSCCHSIVADRANTRSQMDAALEKMQALMGRPIFETLTPMAVVITTEKDQESPVQTALLNDLTQFCMPAEVHEIKDDIQALSRMLTLAEGELQIHRQLERSQDISRAKVLRVERGVADIQAQIVNKRNRYFQDAQAEITKAQEDLSTQNKQLRDRLQALENTTLLAPMDGVVNTIKVTTLGVVIKPGKAVIELSAEAAFAEKTSPIVPINTINPPIYYTASVSIRVKEFQAETAREIKLRPGLTATVEIKALDRSELSYLTKSVSKT